MSESHRDTFTSMSSEAVLRARLEEIGAVLEKKYRETSDIGVLTGISGIAVFCFYYSRFSGKQRYADLGSEILTEVFDRINNGYDMHTYCSGISGALWSMEHLREEGFIELESDAVFPALDDFLADCTEQYADENFYDFLHGILGIGHYFLIRYRNTGSGVLKEHYANLLTGMVNRLKKTAITEGDSSKWKSWLVREERLKGYNLGLAHGISGIVNFLSRLLVYPEFSEVRSLLRGAVHYISSWEGAISGTSLFPAWITESGGKSYRNRLGWCYGDPGTGLSLWHAGKALQDDALCTRAVKILEYSTQRTDPEEAGIRDAGLCHGACGIMHIYRYMERQTNRQAFAMAADFWQQKALEMAVHPDGYAGYMQWRGGNRQGWQPETGILEGIAGIGLSIMAELSPDSIKWNECLLIGNSF
ncbi:lanthionine synthetase C family protein [Sinomicrobium pectinilyticum]|nr:lanthionine synthetase C family protein [Sinomicrobium pectinilyticum]